MVVLVTFLGEADQLGLTQLLGPELIARRIQWAVQVYDKAHKGQAKPDWSFAEHFMIIPLLVEGAQKSDAARRRLIASRLKDFALVEKEVRKAKEDVPTPNKEVNDGDASATDNKKKK